MFRQSAGLGLGVGNGEGETPWERKSLQGEKGLMKPSAADYYIPLCVCEGFHGGCLSIRRSGR